MTRISSRFSGFSPGGLAIERRPRDRDQFALAAESGGAKVGHGSGGIMLLRAE
ncbi:hypothetical protein GCM10023069_10330 [Shinella granuli]